MKNTFKSIVLLIISVSFCLFLSVDADAKSTPLKATSADFDNLKKHFGIIEYANFYDESFFIKESKEQFTGFKFSGDDYDDADTVYNQIFTDCAYLYRMYYNTNPIVVSESYYSDPFGWFNPYLKLPASKVDWMVKNLFYAKANHKLCRGDLWYYYGGYYYVNYQYWEDIRYNVKMPQPQRKSDGSYNVIYNLYGGYIDADYFAGCYGANVSLFYVDGKRVWRINSIKRAYTINDAYGMLIGEKFHNVQSTYNSFGEYLIYDIDKDGTTEIIFYTGTCEADAKFEFYTFNGSKTIKIGEASAGHSVIRSMGSKAGLYQLRGIQGYESLYKIKKSGNSIKISTVYEDKITYEYADVGYEIPSAEIGDNSLAYSKACFTPGKTSSLKVSSKTANSVKLSWKSVPGATGYRVFRRSGSSWKVMKDVTGTSLNVKGLSSGKKYTFAVRAYFKDGVKTVWAKKYVSVSTVTEPAKIKTISTNNGSSSIKLTWGASSGATGYRVYQYDYSKKSYKKLVTTSKRNYTVKKLKPSKQYKFSVRAYTKLDGKVYWGDSKAVVTSTLPDKISSLKASTAKNSVKLTWNEVSNVNGYRIYKYNYNKKDYEKLATVKGRIYTIKNLKPGTKYRFSVKAYKKVDGKIYWSDSYAVVDIKTKG